MRLRLRPVAVKRAFANLIDNAVKYGGGACVVLENEPEAATVQVEDDGPVSPMEHWKLFSSRFTGWRNRATAAPAGQA
jgi:K+-sensing histidine kinase KdpD